MAASLLGALLFGLAGSSGASAATFVGGPLEPVRTPFAPIITDDTVWASRTSGPPPLLRRNPLVDVEEREAVLAELLPPVPLEPADPASEAADLEAGSAPLAASPSFALVQRQRAALRAAAEFEAAGDRAGERYALERAVALAADRRSVDRETWRALGRARLRTGDAEGAAAAYLAALDTLPSPETDPIAFIELSARLHRDLAFAYRMAGREREWSEALARSASVSVGDADWQYWLQRERYAALPPLPIAPPGAVVEWPRPRQPNPWTDLLRALDAWAQDVPEIDQVRHWLAAAGARRLLFAVGLAMVGLGVLAAFRQRGDLAVAIEYPDELRGVFRVRVVPGAGRWRRAHRQTREAIRKGGLSSRGEHHLVNRETHFQRLLARRYTVMIEGMLFDPESDEVLEDIAEDKIVRVRHRRTVRLEFDVHPERCPVDVLMSWGDKPAVDAAVVAPDTPGSLVRSAGERARVWLTKGRHRLVVGCGDRVVERVVDVSTYRPTRVPVDLAGASVLFKGCPPAVEPYLRGDIEETAKALERDGQAACGYELLAQMHRERGEVSRAADYYESAGRGLEAAALRAELDDYERAATLYLENKQPLRAAEMYGLAGDLVQAGAAYEVARDFDQAIDCYREAGEIDKWINSLERRGRVFEGAQVALANERRPRAIRLLQCIPSDDADFAEACFQLAEAFEREGHFDLAAKKLEDHIATYPMGRAPADKFARLADLLEHAGSTDRAISVLEDLRRQEPTFPNVAQRIEVLRKQLSGEERLARSSGPVALDAAPTAFVVESRYELIEEIGRGGMGVVFEARDRRLDRVVALKRLPEDLRRHHPRALQLFLREAQSLAKLNHPNIVTVHDTDQEDGAFFITMERLHGEPFNRILRERGRLSSENAIGIGRQVAAGLQYAHERGVIHRDIKTANLFLTTERVVKIMDFGLAKVFEEMRGNTTVVSGTPYYMSPEQVLGGPIDHRTDLYSLGITLFELVTGRVPFDQGDIAYHHRHTPPPDASGLVPGLDPALADLIRRLLAKDPAARPPSAQAVLDELRGILL